MTESGGSNAIPMLFWLAVAVVLIWWAVYQGRPGALTVDTNRSPREVMHAAVHAFSARGWTTTTQSTDAVTFTRTKRPSCLVTLFLFFFGIIPGLLYLIAAKKTLTLSVSVFAPTYEDDRNQVMVSWNRNGGGRSAGLAFQKLVAPGAPVRLGQPGIGSVVSSRVRDLVADVRSPKGTQQPATPGQGTPIMVEPPGAPVRPVSMSDFCNTCGHPRRPEATHCANCGLGL